MWAGLDGGELLRRWSPAAPGARSEPWRWVRLRVVAEVLRPVAVAMPADVPHLVASSARSKPGPWPVRADLLRLVPARPGLSLGGGSPAGGGQGAAAGGRGDAGRAAAPGGRGRACRAAAPGGGGRGDAGRCAALGGQFCQKCRRLLSVAVPFVRIELPFPSFPELASFPWLEKQGKELYSMVTMT